MTDLRDKGPGGLNLLTATEMAAQIASGETTSEAIVSDCLARIDARNGDLDAWAYIDADKALAQAHACDGEDSKGVLHGVPVGIKDILDTADMPTEYGSSLYPGHQPDKDCLTVQKLREAGAVILGKAKTTEFASPYPTTTHNPHNLDCTPGVSSAGSAAAVADFMVPLSNGTQTGGSVIRPASLCGVYGYKASLTALDPAGIEMWKPNIDTLGHFGRSMADLALMRAALVGGAPTDLSLPNGETPRVGICRTGDWENVTPENVAMMDWVINLLKDGGVSVAETDFPVNFADVMRSHGVTVGTDSVDVTPELVMNNLDKINPWTKMRLEDSQSLTADDLSAAQTILAEARATLAGEFEKFDLLLTPGAEGEAPADLTSTLLGGFNSLWTIMYTPCVTLPAFNGPHDMPVGLQIIGPIDQDDRTLALSAWVDDQIKTAGGPIVLS